MIEYTVKVHANGDKEWLLNDKRHREDGPAIEYADGAKSWWLNGERHRKDGPAIEWVDGTKEWYINGEYLTEEEFNDITKKPIAAPCEGREVEIDGVVYVLKAKVDKG